MNMFNNLQIDQHNTEIILYCDLQSTQFLMF